MSESSEAYYSYSQAGEDRIAAFILNAIGLKEISYLDIGSANPVADNNTYLFYKRGGRGVLVEATTTYNDLYYDYRPNDILLNIACVPQGIGAEGFVEFYLSSDAGWNSVLADHAEIARGLGKSTGSEPVIRVPAKTISEILVEHFPEKSPDVLSLDIEGVDHLVLQEIDFQRWRPSIMIIENAGGQRIHDPIMELRDYSSFGYTYVNSLYVDNRALSVARF